MKQGLDKFCNQRDLTKTSEDPCYLFRRDKDSRKPLKYVTYNYHPYGCNVQATCYPGQFYDDGHVNGCNIQDESKLKIRHGNVLTNRNVHQELPALPVQMPRIKGCFDVDPNSALRWQTTDNWKPCTNVTEQSFSDRTFQYFDHLCYNPQDADYIIPEDSFRQEYHDPRYSRSGVDTRHDRLEKYRNGQACIYNRVMDPVSNYTSYAN